MPDDRHQPGQLLSLAGAPPSIPVEMELRDAIQQVALEFPAYGYRRITRELNRRGFAVNHKRVLRLMRHDNLLCLRRKSFVVTTDSRHSLRVYPNLAGAITPVSVNQLWRADITYIRHFVLPGRVSHGLCVYPQPGRYSLGHTGVFR
jgi:transposase InsO family protein